MQQYHFDHYCTVKEGLRRKNTNYNFNLLFHVLPPLLDLKMTLFSKSKHFPQPVLSASHATQTGGNGQKRNLEGL